MRNLFVSASLVAILSTPALAADDAATVSPLTVIGRTPIGGAEAEADRAPLATSTVDTSRLRAGDGSALLDALELRVAGVALSNAQGNPYQPSLTYRGFEASPLQGAAQGLAVYVDGVRLNQPFGDTVNWDLIPEAAIRSVTVEGSNPVFGLNAVGGALSARLKTGFSDPGGLAELSGGSFGRRHASLQYGAASGARSVYIAATGYEEEGWRDFSPTSLRQVYADLGWRAEALEVHASLTGADNDLTGNGTSPVELLAADREAVFTHPDRTRNRFGQARLSAAFAASPELSLQGQAYLGRLRQRTENGDATDAEPCEDDEDVLCLDDDGPLLTDADGRPIEASLGDGPYAQLNTGATNTTSYGAAGQLVWKRALAGRPNTFTAGASLDAGRSWFRATSSLGELTDDRGFGGPPILIDQAYGPITPVELNTRTVYAGLYGLNVTELTPALTLTLSGRLNHADIRLHDRLGEALNGEHQFTRFNPAAGLAYDFGAVTAYAGYAQANRAPTPAELSCASPEAPCSLTNFFVADPPLEQVRAETFEAGLRGAGGGLSWSAGVFRTDTRDDITLVASEFRGRGYFQNVGRTRRQGVEAQAAYARGPFEAFAAYALTNATFRSPLVLNSPDNPSADEDGLIAVSRGDRMPGVARHRAKMEMGYAPEPWRIALNLVASSGRGLFGDEANQQPDTGGYVVANLVGAWRLSRAVELFASVENLTDAKYETFGTFSQTDEVELAEAPGAEDPRSLSPAPPRSLLVGVRLSF